ncbi:YigZ family protein [Campylobacter sp. US33a]|uniref:YigZ family protein n=1 Tax=Campylobacter sp. CCS1377 TaxID=3158229 RepID=A0AAU7E4L5_9BACT|nr:YigZ family protein [Campylobacter sp. US33a]MCW1361009.1 IMPACT family protein [Campylobacter jejuni]TEY00498.1 YigZ family protein [Campylobacter sp. US33a]
MQSVDKIYKTQIEIKKSTFLSFLCPFKEFKILITNLKQEHPKAVHFVYAYRALNDLNQIIEDKSDDGEPKGTSGMPTLNVLRGYDLVNVAIVTVRYFGGIKLGTGGLVRAYSDAANAAISCANLITFEFKSEQKICVDFANLGKIEHFLNKNSFEFYKEFKEDKIILNISLNEEEKKKLQDFCKNFSPLNLQFLN